MEEAVACIPGIFHPFPPPDHSLFPSLFPTASATHIAVVEGQGGVRSDKLVLLVLGQVGHGGDGCDGEEKGAWEGK